MVVCLCGRCRRCLSSLGDCALHNNSGPVENSCRYCRHVTEAVWMMVGGIMQADQACSSRQARLGADGTLFQDAIDRSSCPSYEPMVWWAQMTQRTGGEQGEPDLVGIAVVQDHGPPQRHRAGSCTPPPAQAREVPLVTAVSWHPAWAPDKLAGLAQVQGQGPSPTACQLPGCFTQVLRAQPGTEPAGRWHPMPGALFSAAVVPQGRWYEAGNVQGPVPQKPS